MVRPEELIAQLLLRHSCVIIPGFGGFVAKRASATIDYEKGIMLPPKKGVLFNRQLINNDGLLISEYSIRRNISFDHSAEEVKIMVQEWNAALSKGARVTIDRVGYLYFDQEKNLCFEQDRFYNLLLESFGLGKVHFEAEKVQAPIIELNPTVKETAIQLPKRSVAWKYVAAACLLPVAFYSFWIPVKTNVLESGVFSFSDFNPFSKKGPSSYTKLKPLHLEWENSTPSEWSSDEYEFLPGLTFPIDAPEVEVEKVSIEHDKNECRNQFIVGCFGDQQNVDLMIGRLAQAGIEAYVYDTSNGLQRVSAGGADNDADFSTLRQKLTSLGIKGWIYRAR